MKQWRVKARQLKQESYTLYLAYGDPRVPWYARLFVAGLIAYAFSPIDLIPDFIPVLGYLDDLVLLPLGVILAIQMIPPPVLNEYREKAQQQLNQEKPKNWTAAAIIILFWFLCCTVLFLSFIRLI